MKTDIEIKSTEDGKFQISYSIGRMSGGGIEDSLPKAIFSLIHTYEDERIRAMFAKPEIAA